MTPRHSSGARYPKPNSFVSRSKLWKSGRRSNFALHTPPSSTLLSANLSEVKLTTDLRNCASEAPQIRWTAFSMQLSASSATRLVGRLISYIRKVFRYFGHVEEAVGQMLQIAVPCLHTLRGVGKQNHALFGNHRIYWFRFLENSVAAAFCLSGFRAMRFQISFKIDIACIFRHDNRRQRKTFSRQSAIPRTHASRPLAAVGVWPLRQPCVQHPVVAPAQGVDERGGVRTTVKHFATLGVQRIDFQMEHFLENADNIHNFQIPAFDRTYRTGCHQCGHQFNQIAVRTCSMSV